ncbi:MAG: bifunctional ADP-dependent NAD(P)H-hydrate dehydratase/NAD(P)H-hydrate epimerase, partial [bacterium]
GIKTKTVLLSDRNDVGGDAKENLRRLEATGAELAAAETTKALACLMESAAEFDLVIDGILGTGVKGDVSGHFAEAISFINGLRKLVVSIDVPSGLDATSGRACGIAALASTTVTMGLPKTGLVRLDGVEQSGRIRVADIGIPDDMVRDVAPEGELTVEQDLYHLFDQRRRASHKGDYGRILMVAGSPGMTGAACLAASAAMRSGSGLVTVAAPRGLNPILEMKLTEAMTLPLPETAAGSPMLVDADGLNALAEDVGILKKIKAPVILTPHPGEMARLLGKDTTSIPGDRIAVAGGFARDYGVTMVLKGALTVVADTGGHAYVNASGNPGMASGGSGDVLSGVIASLWGQGMSPTNAARAGSFVHGDAGDRAMLCLGERAFIASDVIDDLPRAIEGLVRRKW